MIQNHPDLPAHLRNLEPKAPNQVLRVLRRTQRASRRDKQAKAFAAPLPPPPPLTLQPHEDSYPDYPEDWIDVTAEAREDYLLPTHAVNVPSRTVYPVAGASAVALQGTPSGVRDSIMALKDIDTELHEHAHTVHGIRDLVLAQNRDVHVLALKKLVLNEPIDHDVFPENVREFARNYYRQKKGLLFINKNGVFCVQYSPSQRPLHERPCMIIMPQLYHMRSYSVRMTPWDIRVSPRWWLTFKNATHGLVVGAAWADTLASASPVNRYVTSLVTSDST